tara:strand:- start:107 stop:832 length:726 start_codon:yes stop_codon:yes gene_type:complete
MSIFSRLRKSLQGKLDNSDMMNNMRRAGRMRNAQMLRRRLPEMMSGGLGGFNRNVLARSVLPMPRMRPAKKAPSIPAVMSTMPPRQVLPMPPSMPEPPKGMPVMPPSMPEPPKGMPVMPRRMPPRMMAAGGDVGQASGDDADMMNYQNVLMSLQDAIDNLPSELRQFVAGALQELASRQMAMPTGSRLSDRDEDIGQMLTDLDDGSVKVSQSSVEVSPNLMAPDSGLDVGMLLDDLKKKDQ